MKRNRTQAIVIGVSMAGMLAARVLADLFERVIVLERDLLPERPEVRPGVPQARHLHALLPRGRRILEHNFLGITAELETAGAEILDVAIASDAQKYFTLRLKRGLITDGMFRFIRHPNYLGEISSTAYLLSNED